jgi:LuxR family maltose regulon positive regulatory protein
MHGREPARRWSEEPIAAQVSLGRSRGGSQLRAVAFLLLEAIADDLSGDPALPAELAALLADVKRSAPPPAGPLWPSEPLTQSETRVLRYLPTHLGTPEIAAELFVSANTVKTHLQHLYRKLGAHSRGEAVQRARASGLLAGSSARPQNAGPSRHT